MGKDCEVAVEIVLTKLRVKSSGVEVIGGEEGRGKRGNGGKEEKRLIEVREWTPLAALMSARSFPGMPECDLTMWRVTTEMEQR